MVPGKRLAHQPHLSPFGTPKAATQHCLSSGEASVLNFGSVLSREPASFHPHVGSLAHISHRLLHQNSQLTIVCRFLFTVNCLLPIFFTLHRAPFVGIFLSHSCLSSASLPFPCQSAGSIFCFAIFLRCPEKSHVIASLMAVKIYMTDCKRWSSVSFHWFCARMKASLRNVFLMTATTIQVLYSTITHTHQTQRALPD